MIIPRYPVYYACLPLADFSVSHAKFNIATNMSWVYWILCVKVNIALNKHIQVINVKLDLG